jgi:hypothetical protein
MPAVVIRHPHEHERKIDPYLALEGGVAVQEAAPAKPKKARKPIKQQITDDLAAAQTHAKERGRRYDLYLDALLEFAGDRVSALAAVFKLDADEVIARYDELIEEVQIGVPHSSVSEMLERMDVSQATRVKVLRKWMLSNNPAAALKSVEMIGEIDDKPRSGNLYERYIRVVLDEAE